MDPSRPDPFPSEHRRRPPAPESDASPGGGPPIPDDVVGFLASTELFRGLEPGALLEIADEVEWVGVGGGEEVCRQGEPGNDLFLVVSGKLRVFHSDHGHEERFIREIARGENFGEMSLLTGAPRSATVRAARDSVLVRLSQERFLRILARHTAPMLSLTRMLARWLERSNQRNRSFRHPTTIAVVAASPAVPLGDFCEHLARALSAIGSTLHLRAETVDAHLHPGAIDESEGGEGYRRVTRWLSDQEAAHQLVLYEADATRSAWTRRCARQADRLVTVAWAPSDPARAELETPLERSGALTSLVLLHPRETSQPVATDRWPLDRYDTHHHVRLDETDHFGRLARHLTGRAVGLVLGGGGAKGFAHIGVVRAMRTLGVPIDRIGGTSIGAVVGALVAMGLDHQEIVGIIRERWAVTRPEKDYTLPLISLLSGRKGRRLCDEMFGDVAVEDLWIPYFCCSANLTRSELVVHRRGGLRRHALASVAIPGIAPPVVEANGDLLVDGAILNNVPAEVMVGFGGGPVVAVDVTEKEAFSLEAWGGRLPSPRQVLMNLLSPFTPRRPYPGIFRILLRSSTLSSAREAQQVREKVDLYLEPSVSGYDLFAWNAVEEIAEAGYRHAMDRIRVWRDTEDPLGALLREPAAPGPPVTAHGSDAGP